MLGQESAPVFEGPVRGDGQGPAFIGGPDEALVVGAAEIYAGRQADNVHHSIEQRAAGVEEIPNATPVPVSRLDRASAATSRIVVATAIP